LLMGRSFLYRPGKEVDNAHRNVLRSYEDPAQDGERDAADSENDGVREKKDGSKEAKTVPARKDPDQSGDSFHDSDGGLRGDQLF